MVVAVCVITYHRAQGLGRLLDGLNALHFGEAPPPEIRVIVVDNDPDESARSTCENKAKTLRWPVHYVSEPRRGIPQARNRSVREALQQGATHLAFIDDDEVPNPDWLAELLRVQKVADADVVSGPVLCLFEDPSNWITQSSIFHELRLTTGAAIFYFATGNLLVRATVLAFADRPFDERLALTGGSDTHLARRLHQAGCQMVWADQAIVYEHVPASRLKVSWVLKRSFRYGNTFAITERLAYPSSLRQMVRLLKGLRRVVQGVVGLPWYGLQGRICLLEALLLTFRGLGEITGILGIRYKEYTHIHGD